MMTNKTMTMMVTVYRSDDFVRYSEWRWVGEFRQNGKKISFGCHGADRLIGLGPNRHIVYIATIVMLLYKTRDGGYVVF